MKESRKEALVNLPPNLADVALLDIRDVCAAARMSASWLVGPAKFIPELLNVMRGPWTHPVIRTSV